MDNVSLSATWLRDNWRPLSALLLASLPLLRALGLAQGLTDQTFGTLLEVTGLFLALYAGGRTAEKVAASMAEARVGVAQAGANTVAAAQVLVDQTAAQVVDRVTSAMGLPAAPAAASPGTG